jgi:hypothetical protein
VADDLRQALDDYGRGLDTELALLAQLDALSLLQQRAGEANDLADLARVSDGRELATRALVEVEERLRPIRESIARRIEEARRLPSFRSVADRHRRAEQAVMGVLGRDRATLAALHDAEDARRTAAQAIEAGEATLAAYRKVISPPVASAGLVSERG